MPNIVEARPGSAALLSRVSLARLSGAEKRIADYLLSVSEYRIAGLTAAELAERTKTSRSTIVRLSRRLGFSGVKELRNALLSESRSMRIGISAGPAPEPSIVPSDSLADIALKVFDTASVRALKFAEVLASSTELGRLVEALRAAPSVQVFGAGASGVVAFDLHQRLLRLGIRIGFAEDHHNQIASASLMAPGELAIAISYSGQTRPTLQATEVAHSRGATIAAVLGVHGSPLERLADIAIITPPGGNLFGTDPVMTRILEMLFNEVLFHCLLAKNPEMRANVDRIEATLSTERI